MKQSEKIKVVIAGGGDYWLAGFVDADLRAMRGREEFMKKYCPSLMKQTGN